MSVMILLNVLSVCLLTTGRCAHLLKEGHGIFDVRKDISACCAYEDEIGID